MSFSAFFNTYTPSFEVIEEKDNRVKILKMGVPQDVADFLHNLHNKYSLWFADQLKKLPGFQLANNKLNYANNLRTQMQGIVDWVSNTPNIILKQYSWADALDAAQQYHKNMTASNIEGIEQNTIIKKYDNGFYWVDLESTRDNCEASAMGHCATTHKASTLYSLRKFEASNQTTEPFITLAISPDEGTWSQCKGKYNSKPKKEYHYYISDILIHSKVYSFVSEYDARNDFTDTDLVRYIEEHEDDFPDSEEILKKINSNRIQQEDFQKILDGYKFKYYDISIYDDYDESSSISINASFRIELKYSDTGLDKDIIDDNFTMGYRSPAKDLLSDIIDEYIHNIEVETSYSDSANTFYIRGDIELDSSEGSYELSESGLESFERHCEHYKDLDEKFDKAEFISSTLPKLLELDGVISTDLGDFVEYINTNIPSIKAERDKRTLDVTVKFGTIPLKVHRKDLSRLSVMGYTPVNLDSYKEEYKSKSHLNDFRLYSIFWDFIKAEVLPNFSRLRVELSADTGVKLSTNYYSDDRHYHYDFDKERERVSSLVKQLPAITQYLHTYEEKIVLPFVRSGKPITPHDIIIPQEINDSTYQISLYTKNKVYIGSEYLNSQSDRTPEHLHKLVKDHLASKSNMYEYEEINTRKIYDFLDELVNRQLSFKNFFEGYEKVNTRIYEF